MITTNRWFPDVWNPLLWQFQSVSRLNSRRNVKIFQTLHCLYLGLFLDFYVKQHMARHP
uniref:Uncharacterized protein MANES_14G157300 n=1 Tax=Rhizophora mucronata TaxID=61149 RepID=A0A2P2KPG0_RHIMU